MATVPSEIESYYDITVRFRIENVREYLALDGPQDAPKGHQTDKFGSGWYLKWFTVKKDDEVSLGLYFYTEPRGYPEPITWTVIANSLDGNERYFRRTVAEHTFKANDNALGWSTFMTKIHWERYAILQQENALHITSTIRARMAPTPSLDKCLDVSHGLLTTGDRPCDISFVANSNRSRSGQLSGPRRMFADKDYLRKVCPRLGRRTFLPNIHSSYS